MSNKLSPLFNSTSALLEFQIWSDATSHATLFTWHAQQLVRTGLSLSQPAWTMFSLCGMVALHDLRWNPLFSSQMICIGKTRGWGWCVVYKTNPLHTSPFWLNIVLDVPKWTITQYTHTTQLHFADRNYPWLFYLFSQSQQSLTKYICFVLSKIVT